MTKPSSVSSATDTAAKRSVVMTAFHQFGSVSSPAHSPSYRAR